MLIRRRVKRRLLIIAGILALLGVLFISAAQALTLVKIFRIFPPW